MQLNPTFAVLVVIAAIFCIADARPWKDNEFLPSVYASLANPDLYLEDTSYERDALDEKPSADSIWSPQNKRFFVDSFHLFRPFYHTKPSNPNLRNYPKRSSSLRDLIARLMAMKGDHYRGRATSMRFGPGGK